MLALPLQPTLSTAYTYPPDTQAIATFMYPPFLPSPTPSPSFTIGMGDSICLPGRREPGIENPGA